MLFRSDETGLFSLSLGGRTPESITNVVPFSERVLDGGIGGVEEEPEVFAAVVAQEDGYDETI